MAATAGPKIRTPIQRAGLVRRSALLVRLRRTAAQPLVVLMAPPGYGKTTVLAQWADADGREVAWVTVDEADNDPARMLDHIGLALRGPGPDSGSDGPGGLSVARLAERMRDRGTPVLLVLDDVHHLHRAPVPDLLVDLATRLPPGSQLAVASRSQPPLKLGRLRAERRCAEFGSADLALDAGEAAAVLALAGVEISTADARRLVERTEGWPAGVYLAAVAQRDRVDLTDAPGSISGNDAYIADFFRDELLARESPETVRFLLRTSVLGQLSAALCDAVLDTTGSAARLAEIERRNLFLVPLDHRREWYRYHRLFAETLVAELRRREPGEERRGHRRAAAWYEREGSVKQAVEHWIAAGTQAEVTRLVARHGREFVAAGRLATVRTWIEALGPDAVDAYPPAALTAAWAYALSGDPAAALRFLLVADRADFTGPMPDGHTSLRSGVVVLRASQGALGVDRMLADARLAVELEPPGSPWRPVAATALGVAELFSGSPEAAIKRLEEAALLGRQRGRASAQVALAELALLAAERGSPQAADRYAESAFEVMVAGNLQDDMTSILTYLAAAQVHLRAGRRDAARHQLGTALRLYLGTPPAAFPWLAVQAALVLGEVSLQLDDVAAARTRVEDARRHLTRLLTEGDLRDRLRSLSAAVARAGSRRPDPSAMALSSAEERVLRLLPTHLSLGEIGDELHVSRNTVKSHVGAVYRKLQASTRTEAVTRARELGLLPG